jgi:hypothetical protein
VAGPVPQQEGVAEGRRPALLDFFLGIWFVTSFVFFSLAATKQPNYVLPALPPLILLAARWWQAELAGETAGKVERWAMVVFNLLVGLGLAVFFFLLSRMLPQAVDQARVGMNPDAFEYAFPPADPVLGWSPLLIGALLVLAAAAALCGASRKNWRALLASFSIGAVILVGGAWHFTLPSVLDYLQAPSKELSRQVARVAGPEDVVASFGLYKPTQWFYTGRHIQRVRVNKQDELEGLLSGERRVWVLSRLSLLPQLGLQPRFHLIAIRAATSWDRTGRAVCPPPTGTGREARHIPLSDPGASSPFFVNLIVFTFVLLLARVLELTELVVVKGVQPGTIGRLLAYSVPFLLSLTVPMSTLLAPCWPSCACPATVKSRC